jgi:hypothetical protein
MKPGMSGEHQVRACVSLSPGALARADALAAHLKLSRSAIVDAAIRYVADHYVDEDEGERDGR